MKKIKYNSEIDFSETEYEFDDFHFWLCEKIRSNFKCEKHKPSPILCDRHGKYLKFAINNGEENLERDIGKDIYIIKIEKLIK